jgi:hypothetical protein
MLEHIVEYCSKDIRELGKKGNRGKGLKGMEIL